MRVRVWLVVDHTLLVRMPRKLHVIETYDATENFELKRAIS